LLGLNIQLVSLGFLGIHQLPIKKWIFLIEGVFFLLTSPLMGDPLVPFKTEISASYRHVSTKILDEFPATMDKVSY